MATVILLLILILGQRARNVEDQRYREIYGSGKYFI